MDSRSYLESPFLKPDRELAESLQNIVRIPCTPFPGARKKCELASMGSRQISAHWKCMDLTCANTHRARRGCWRKLGPYIYGLKSEAIPMDTGSQFGCQRAVHTYCAQGGFSLRIISQPWLVPVVLSCPCALGQDRDTEGSWRGRAALH